MNGKIEEDFPKLTKKREKLTFFKFKNIEEYCCFSNLQKKQKNQYIPKMRGKILTKMAKRAFIYDVLISVSYKDTFAMKRHESNKLGWWKKGTFFLRTKVCVISKPIKIYWSMTFKLKLSNITKQNWCTKREPSQTKINWFGIRQILQALLTDLVLVSLPL